MYDIHKIIIVGKWSLHDNYDLKTIAMETDGMRVMSVLYLDDQGSIDGDIEAIKTEIKNQLYDDMYDPDDLKIKAKEVYDGKDAVKKLTKYISKRWDKETQIYFFEPTDNVFDKLQYELNQIDGSMYLFDYYDIFHDDYNSYERKPIKEIMADHGLKMELLLPDSYVAFAYYLAALIEKLFSR